MLSSRAARSLESSAAYHCYIRAYQAEILGDFDGAPRPTTTRFGRTRIPPSSECSTRTFSSGGDALQGGYPPGGGVRPSDRSRAHSGDALLGQVYGSTKRTGRDAGTLQEDPGRSTSKRRRSPSYPGSLLAAKKEYGRVARRSLPERDRDQSRVAIMGHYSLLTAVRGRWGLFRGRGPVSRERPSG